MILTEEEIEHIIIMCKDDIENGKSALYNNPDAEMLEDLWKEAMKLDNSIMYKLGEKQ